MQVADPVVRVETAKVNVDLTGRVSPVDEHSYAARAKGMDGRLDGEDECGGGGDGIKYAQSGAGGDSADDGFQHALFRRAETGVNLDHFSSRSGGSVEQAAMHCVVAVGCSQELVAGFQLEGAHHGLNPSGRVLHKHGVRGPSTEKGCHRLSCLVDLRPPSPGEKGNRLGFYFVAPSSLGRAHTSRNGAKAAVIEEGPGPIERKLIAREARRIVRCRRHGSSLGNGVIGIVGVRRPSTGGTVESKRLAPRVVAGFAVAALVGVAVWNRPVQVGDGSSAMHVASDALSVPRGRSLPTRAANRLPDGPSWLPAELSVEVVTVQGHPSAHVRVESDCGWFGRTGRAGRWTQLLAPSECDVRAVREDGLLRVTSVPQRVTLTAGQTSLLRFELPEAPQGGIGLAVGPHADGLEVLAVRPESPAARANLRPGQVILDVDGQPTQGWTASTFARAGIGEVGSSVTVGVGSDDTGLGRVEVVLERVWLPPGTSSKAPQAVPLASLTDAQRREMAAIRETLSDFDDGDGLDSHNPTVRALIDRVHAIVDTTH